MKKHIAAGAFLLLTVSTAVAGTLLYGADRDDQSQPGAQDEATVTLASWNASASTTDYITPKVPI